MLRRTVESTAFTVIGTFKENIAVQVYSLWLGYYGGIQLNQIKTIITRNQEKKVCNC